MISEKKPRIRVAVLTKLQDPLSIPDVKSEKLDTHSDDSNASDTASIASVDTLLSNLQNISASINPQDQNLAVPMLDHKLVNINPGYDNSQMNLNSKYFCRECGRDCVTLRSLNKHVREGCGKGPKFTCDYCKKVFKQRHNCQRHMWSVHGHPIESNK